MPRAAILKGYANKIIPLDGLATFLTNQYGAEWHAAVQGAAEKIEKNDKNDKVEKIPVSSQRS
jgi:hypothetical protein